MRRAATGTPEQPRPQGAGCPVPRPTITPSHEGSIAAPRQCWKPPALRSRKHQPVKFSAFFGFASSVFRARSMAGHPAGSPPTCSPPRWAPGLPRGSFHCYRSPVHPDTTAHAAAPKPWGGRTRGPPLNGFGVGTPRHLAQPRVGAGMGCRHLSHLQAPSEQGPSPSANPQGWPPERFTHTNKTLANPEP